jgi:phage terminase large subunit-like protein
MALSKDRALEHIEFIQLLKHTGDFYGQPFLLLDWEYDTLRNVYGTVKENGLRQYQLAYLEIPKKNGKTELVAAIGIDHLTNDLPGGQIYCCAAEKEQAGLVYKAAKQMIEQDADLKKLLKVIDSKKEIQNTETGTFLKVLSAEAYSKHGLNPTVIIFDELHAQPNRDLWDVMTFGAGAARKEPLWWVITTAGDDPDKHSIGWEIHEKAQKILDGEQINPAWYVKMYNAPEDADIFDEKLWYEINPSLGKTINIESVRQEALEARNSESSEKLFRWLRLNQWVSLKRIGWLPLTLWDSTEGKWNPAELIGKRCYAGLDLSSTTDLTALKLLFPPQDGIPNWREISEAWIPEDSMKERIARDGVPYDKWVKSKHLQVTPGNAVDYEFVEARILAANQQYKIEMLGTDPWNSRMLTQRLDKAGVKLYEVPQNMANMSPAMKEQERLMRVGSYTHEHNPIARWCFGNTNIAVDGNGNIKPMKNKSIERIDITVAGIIAMAVAIQMGANKISAYGRHGLRSLSD